jgi:hypothetical protein
LILEFKKWPTIVITVSAILGSVGSFLSLGFLTRVSSKEKTFEEMRG